MFVSYKVVASPVVNEALGLACRNAARKFKEPFDRVSFGPYINDIGPKTRRSAVHQAALGLVDATTKAGFARADVQLAVDRLALVLELGGRLDQVDIDSNTPLALIFKEGNDQTVRLLSQVAQRPELRAHPISSLTSVFHIDLDNVEIVTQTLPNQSRRKILAEAIDRYLTKPVFPVSVQMCKDGRGKGLFANQDIQAGQLISAFLGIPVAHPPHESVIGAVKRYLSRMHVQDSSAQTLVQEVLARHTSHAISFGRVGASDLFSVVSRYDDEKISEFPLANFGNEGCPNSFYVTLGNLSVLIATRPIVRGEECTYFYGPTHNGITRLKTAGQYRLDVQSVRDLAVLLVQTTRDDYASLLPDQIDPSLNSESILRAIFGQFRHMFAESICFFPRVGCPSNHLVQFINAEIRKKPEFARRMHQIVMGQPGFVSWADFPKDLQVFLNAIAATYVIDHPFLDWPQDEV